MKKFKKNMLKRCLKTCCATVFSGTIALGSTIGSSALLTHSDIDKAWEKACEKYNINSNWVLMFDPRYSLGLRISGTNLFYTHCEATRKDGTQRILYFVPRESLNNTDGVDSGCKERQSGFCECEEDICPCMEGQKETANKYSLKVPGAMNIRNSGPGEKLDNYDGIEFLVTDNGEISYRLFTKAEQDAQNSQELMNKMFEYFNSHKSSEEKLDHMIASEKTFIENQNKILEQLAKMMSSYYGPGSSVTEANNESNKTLEDMKALLESLKTKYTDINTLQDEFNKLSETIKRSSSAPVHPMPMPPIQVPTYQVPVVPPPAYPALPDSEYSKCHDFMKSMSEMSNSLHNKYKEIQTLQDSIDTLRKTYMEDMERASRSVSVPMPTAIAVPAMPAPVYPSQPDLKHRNFIECMSKLSESLSKVQTEMDALKKAHSVDMEKTAQFAPVPPQMPAAALVPMSPQTYVDNQAETLKALQKIQTSMQTNQEQLNKILMSQNDAYNTLSQTFESISNNLSSSQQATQQYNGLNGSFVLVPANNGEVGRLVDSGYGRFGRHRHHRDKSSVEVTDNVTGIDENEAGAAIEENN